MAPCKSQRAPKSLTVWGEKQTPFAALEPKITAQSASGSTGLLESHEIRDSHPPFILLQINETGSFLSILAIIQLFYTEAMMAMIVAATNSYGACARQN